MKKWLPVLLVTGLMAVMAPIAQGQEDGQGDGKVVLRMGMTNDIDGLNPFKIFEIPSYEVMSLNYNLLVEFSDEDFSPAPGLAESWETSEDGLTWTFHLNPDAVWSDGEPITAEDVKYTFERILEEKQALYLDYIRQVETIETPDDHTVVMTTNKPSAQMLSMFVYILPKHIWEDVPADETKQFDNLPTVGSGPFQAVEWRRGQFVRLEANENYFGGAPHVDEIIMQFYDNEDTVAQAIRQGEIDYVYNLPVNLLQSLEGEPNIETYSASDPGFTELAFNVYDPKPESIKEFGAPKTSTGHPALLDVRVRQAINWLIDEEALTERILKGQGVPGSTLVPPALAAYHLELEPDELMTYDVERAQELLSEAGWEDTNNDGTLDKGGEDLALRLFVRSEDSDSRKAGQFIQGWLEDAGIDVEATALTDNALTDTIYEADFDMFIWGWGSDPDPDFILSVLTCDQIMGWSDSFWCDEEYSRLYQEQKTQLDIEERAETIKEMQRIAYEDSPYIIYYYDNQLDAYRTDRLTGWTELPTSAEQGQVMFTDSNTTYLNLRPVSAEAAAAQDDGTSPIVWILVGVVVIALIIIVGAIMRRRTAEERA